jgi:hypothetical protein
MFDSKLDMLLYLESTKGQLSRDVEAIQVKLDNIEKDIELLKADMVFDIKEYGLDYSTDDFNITIRKGREKIVIDDVDKLPRNMITTRTYTKEEPSKTAIKQAINDGHEIDGARLVVGDDSLSIKVT